MKYFYIRAKKKMLFFVFACFFSLLPLHLHAQKWFEMMNDERVNFYDVQREAEQYFAEHGTGKGTGYKLYKRWEYEMQFEIDELGNRKKNITILEEFERYQQKRSGREAAVQAGDDWKEMGPTYWSRTSGWNPGVGRITCVSVDPKNNSVIYIASPGGGAWKTSNGGTNWTPLTDRLPGMVMFSVGIDPVNTNTVYFGSDRLGIYKSTNGGSSMSAINNGYPTSSKTNKIIVHPTNSSIVLAASSAGIYRSTNGGASWTQSISGGFNDIEFKPGDPNTVYACGNKFFKSTNGGASFSQINNGIPGSGRSFIAVTPANPSYVYMLQARENEFGYLYRSTDSGNNFVTRVTGSPASATNYFGYSPNGTDAGGQAFHDMAICVSPSNPEEVHIAGIICWKSTNGGTSFVATTEWSYPNNRGYNHADVHALEYVGSTIFSGSDGGIFRSNDQGDNWTDLSRGLGIRQFYKIGCAATDATMVGGGSQDNGHSIVKNGSWIDWLGADGMDVMIDHKNSNIIYACTQNGGLNKSINGGQSRTSVTKPSGDGNWVTPLAMDPVNSSIIYIGLAEMHRSTNGGSSWTQISSVGGSGRFDNITIAPSNGNYIYASKGNTLYLTTNGGSSWSNITAGLSGRITAITVHESNPGKVAVSTSNGSSKVYKSTNAGASWTSLQRSLPNISANTLVFQNGSSEGLYVGMDVGVYFIDNTLSDWVPFMTNLPNVKIYELEIHHASGKLRAATHGRGLWESGLYRPTVTNVPPSVSLTSPGTNSTFTAPATVNVAATANDTDGSISKVEFFNGTVLLATDATAPYSFSWTNVGAGTYNITAKATDNSGATATSAIARITVNPLPNTPVIVYQNCNNDPGYVIGLNVGTYTTAQLVALGIRDNDISSIKVQSGYVVTVYSEDNFAGTSQVYTSDQGCLTNTGFNDVISSVRVSLVNQLPTVAMTSPTATTSYTAPATLSLAASASDADGTISKVEFFNGTVLLATDVTAPYSYIWSNVSAGNYTLTARATDNVGDVSTSASLAITVSALPTSPVIVYQHCNNDPGYVVGLNVGTYTTAQLVALGVRDNDISSIKVQSGYEVTVYSEDNFTGTSQVYTSDQGCMTSTGFNDVVSSIRVRLVQSNQAPVVSLTSPSNNASYTSPATVLLSANATDADGSVAKVDFYNGSTLLSSDNTSPYSFNWTGVAAGTYTLTAKATDNAGAVTTSSALTVSVVAPVNKLPAVSLTAPLPSSSFDAPASIGLTATASDPDGSISRVEFYNGSSLLFSDLSAPYAYTWNNVGAGTYLISARAVDNSGGTAVSSVVEVSVNTVTTVDACVTLPLYSEGAGYVAGAKVKNSGNRYECKPWPYSGWCNGAAWAYAPGTGAYWTDAWNLIGSCSNTPSQGLGVLARDGSASLSLAAVPNPFSGNVQVELYTENSGHATIQLFDATGTVINELKQGYLSTGLHSFTFDGSKLPSGVYFIHCITEHGVFVEKLIKAQ